MNKRKIAYFPVTPPVETWLDKYPVFSFRFYDKDNKEFSIQNLESKKDHEKLIEKLHEFSNKKWNEIAIAEREFWHFHEIDWTETEKQNGFETLEQLQGLSAYQFKIFEEFRIIGAMTHDGSFEIVWFDRMHKLYPRK